MRNIQPIKIQKRKEFAKKYYNKDYDKLNDVEFYIINTNAEIWAYIESIVPDTYANYTIMDFTGNDKRKNKDISLLNSSVVKKIKNNICKYCWGMTWEDIRKKYPDENDKSIIKIFRNKDIMQKRLKEGNNVIVYGESNKPMGRTLIASIIMKEAIKLRKYSKNKIQTYDWVDFSTLRKALVADDYEASDYYSCDWLVVDDINKNFFTTKAQRNFLSECMNPFFMKRLRHKQPTILVFRFDITDADVSIEDDLGVGISSVINNKKTFLIPLN